jgi:hypothetical protein
MNEEQESDARDTDSQPKPNFNWKLWLIGGIIVLAIYNNDEEAKQANYARRLDMYNRFPNSSYDEFYSNCMDGSEYSESDEIICNDLAEKGVNDMRNELGLELGIRPNDR